MKIAGGKGFLALLATHPPLEQRIAALEGRA
jgi:Zn-dependent protease with chaperone function